MSIEEQLIDFHETNGYFIQVTRNPDKNSITVVYPDNIIDDTGYKGEAITYEIVEDHIFKYIGDSNTAIKIKVPTYACRTVVLADITCMCNNFNMCSSLLINYKDGQRVDTETFYILDPPDTEEEQELERNLISASKRIVSGREGGAIAKAGSVEEGYDLVINIFSMRILV